MTGSEAAAVLFAAAVLVLLLAVRWRRRRRPKRLRFPNGIPRAPLPPDG